MVQYPRERKLRCVGIFLFCLVDMRGSESLVWDQQLWKQKQYLVSETVVVTAKCYFYINN